MDGSISWPYVVNVASHTNASKVVKVTLLAGTVSPCAITTGDPLWPFAYGRIVNPGSAVVYQTSPTNVLVGITPADGTDAQ